MCGSAVTGDSIVCTKQEIRVLIAGSKVPEDPRHAENTLKWLLKLEPGANEALQIAALGHDIDRAVEARIVQRADYADYDAFKAAYARNSAVILKEIMEGCGVARDITAEAYRPVCLCKVGIIKGAFINGAIVLANEFRRLGFHTLSTIKGIQVGRTPPRHTFLGPE